MGNKERLGIDIDQANGGSILLAIIVQVDGGVGQMPACSLRWSVIVDFKQ
jgi:hypothetical protein